MKRCITRLKGGDLPQIPVLNQKPPFQVGNKPGPYQRGLAAPGIAHHSHQSMGIEIASRGRGFVPCGRNNRGCPGFQRGADRQTGFARHPRDSLAYPGGQKSCGDVGVDLV
jgi:hypothetical protein